MIKTNKKIYLFGYHQYALYFWAKSIEKKILRKNCILIHIDLHSDFMQPVYDSHSFESSRYILQKIKNKSINHDSFIIPAISMKIVSEVMFCCNRNQINEYGEFNNFEYPKAILTSLERQKIKQDIILDIDIDYFLTFKSNTDLVPMDKKEMKEHLSYVRELNNISTLTTVATSPEIFATERNWKKMILNELLKYLVG